MLLQGEVAALGCLHKRFLESFIVQADPLSADAAPYEVMVLPEAVGELEYSGLDFLNNADAAEQANVSQKRNARQ
jgi:hypothetical protein